MSSIAISIVSHNQGSLISDLISDLEKLNFDRVTKIRVYITLNLPEDESFCSSGTLDIKVIRNLGPKGFGANHNQAFACSNEDYFVVLNPDIRINNNFVDMVFECYDSSWGVIAPRILSPEGGLEDSARKYPSLFRILNRVLLNNRTPDYMFDEPVTNCIAVDWVAGMFLVFDSNIFREVNGFDERFFMYLEDADICQRINKLGYKVLVNTEFSAIHDARRSTFKNLRHLKWHLRSMFRFLFKF